MAEVDVEVARAIACPRERVASWAAGFSRLAAPMRAWATRLAMPADLALLAAPLEG